MTESTLFNIYAVLHYKHQLTS
uniref:Uncharacterized protein n=1 Tax=Arundo donax TaxID=35708 RepID=A0A0A9C5M0_ARUDO